MTHFIYTGFLGRGNSQHDNEWIEKRIKIFKDFTLKSLLNQTNKNFVHWVSWRKEDKENRLVRVLDSYLNNRGYPHVFTYGGLCLWDDRKRNEQVEFKQRLEQSLPLLAPFVKEEYVYQTLLDSDDMYRKDVVEEIQELPYKEKGAAGYRSGFVMNFLNNTLARWNPQTCPPFYTIMFDKETFLNPEKHYYYTHYHSHEYVEHFFDFISLVGKKFIVGIHDDNTTTNWGHRFRGDTIEGEYKLQRLKDFGL